ncbi:hypothetical protein PR003_g4075 [Phytophthora rubi]|uniref:HTH CENPB-type domain-containing protein n=1 Tax=Phytophthora rubi TaxID=129364 RepID=A0A6A3N9F9_9STRA|nr:hypothetical protein PR001_g8037 [Phytophthora rubi]KAE9353044.1 hypothetical protein PR003_g4075 [Phytophthora rubi]
MPHTGRKRTTANGSKPKTYIRLAVSYRFKLRVLRFLDGHSMEKTIERLYPGLLRAHVRSKKRLCYSWKASRELIEAKCAAGLGRHRRHRSHGMGATLPTAAEEHLVRWVNHLRADGVPVTRLMLKLQSRDLYAATGLPRGAFTASRSWRKHFLRRHKLAIRRRTREGQTTPQDASEKLVEISRQVQAKMEELNITKVYNADQTGVNYEYVPTSTVNRRGAKTVWVKCAGKSKERVTAMLLGDSNGNKTDPFLVFKTRLSKVAETARANLVFRHGFGRQLWDDLQNLEVGVQIYGNRAGWWNSELLIEFLCYHFGRRENMHKPVLLLWDEFSGHWRQEVLICARLLNVELMRVPPGYTSVCQPADVAWNRPLKEHLHKQWIEFLLGQVRTANGGAPFKMAPPARSDVIQWIKNAWASLSTSTIIGGYKKAKLLQADLREAEDQPSSEPNWGELIRVRADADNRLSQGH